MQGKNVLFATALTLAISWGLYGQKDIGKDMATQKAKTT